MKPTTIRQHMAEIDGENPLGGRGKDVEVDETMVGGVSRGGKLDRGTHVHVSSKYLERYAKEFEYRFNRRNRAETMLSELLSSFQKPVS